MGAQRTPRRIAKPADRVRKRARGKEAALEPAQRLVAAAQRLSKYAVVVTFVVQPAQRRQEVRRDLEEPHICVVVLDLALGVGLAWWYAFTASSRSAGVIRCRVTRVGTTDRFAAGRDTKVSLWSVYFHRSPRWSILAALWRRRGEVEVKIRLSPT
jgi:hypothetical protein